MVQQLESHHCPPISKRRIRKHGSDGCSVCLQVGNLPQLAIGDKTQIGCFGVLSQKCFVIAEREGPPLEPLISLELGLNIASTVVTVLLFSVVYCSMRGIAICRACSSVSKERTSLYVSVSSVEFIGVWCWNWGH